MQELYHILAEFHLFLMYTRKLDVLDLQCFLNLFLIFEVRGIELLNILLNSVYSIANFPVDCYKVQRFTSISNMFY